jgi:hypothetical protein
MRWITSLLAVLIGACGGAEPPEVSDAASGADEGNGAEVVAGGGVGGGAPMSLPGGFVITAPDGWSLARAEPGYTELRGPDGTEFVLVQAVLGPAGDALRSLQRLARASLGPMRSVEVLATRGSASEAQALLRGVGDDGALRGQALLAVRGGGATLFVIGADEEDFAELAPELVAILRSFGRAPAAASGTNALASGGKPAAQAPPAAASLAYRRVVDAKEQAYSMELPQGWSVDVAMHREGTETRPEASARSPDGRILLFFNDRNVGTFTVPNPTLTSLGFAEGAIYNPAGRPTLVWRYLGGADFAAWWLPSRFGGARVTGGQARPDIARLIAESRYRYGNAVGGSVESGEIRFEVDGRRGFVHATTESFGSPDSRNWSVIFHHGYLADPAVEAVAAQALAHAVATTRIDLRWLQRERRISAIDAERQRETMDQTAAIFRATEVARTAASDERARVMGDLLTGTFRVLDPSTGETGTVQAGSNFYYRVPQSDRVIGTDVDAGRPVDLAPLIRLDWDR